MDRRYKTAQIITGAFAKTLIENAGLLNPGQDHLTILDNACGTGVVTASLHDMLDQTIKDRMELTCGDFSEQMIKSVRERIEENGWRNTTAKLVDAQVGRVWYNSCCENAVLMPRYRKQVCLMQLLLTCWPTLSSWDSRNLMPLSVV